MTTASFLRLVARRWWIYVIAFALAGLAFVLMVRAGGAYSGQAQVIFVAPGEDTIGASNDAETGTLIAFAAVIERELHDGQESDRLAENATLFGAGVENGYRILLPNSGGQWEMSFAQPAITVTAVGPTAAEVSTTLQTQLDRVRALAASDQAAMGVAPDNTIGSEQVPGRLSVEYIGSTRGTQVRAAAALLVIAFGVASVAAILLDRRLTRRRAARAAGLVGSPRIRTKEGIAT